MKMKKLLALVLALVLALGVLSGCQKEATHAQQDQNPSEEQLPPVEDDDVMKKTRTQNVIRNMWVGTLFQMISLFLGFVSRTIFIKIFYHNSNRRSLL